MRVRPLSITVVGWCWLIVSIMNLASALLPDSSPSANKLDLIHWAVQPIGIFIFGLSALCSFLVLRGKNWARIGLTIGMVSDAAKIGLLHGWSGEYSFIHMNVFVASLSIWVLFGRSGRLFFDAVGPVPPLGHQGGTVLCYFLITAFLMVAAAMPALDDPRSMYWLIICGFLAAATYGMGRAFGWAIEPQCSMGWILGLAGVLQLQFILGGFIKNAGGIEAALRFDHADPKVNLWVSCVVTAIFLALGVTLIRRSRKQVEISDSMPLDSTEATRGI